MQKFERIIFARWIKVQLHAVGACYCAYLMIRADGFEKVLLLVVLHGLPETLLQSRLELRLVLQIARCWHSLSSDDIATAAELRLS